MHAYIILANPLGGIGEWNAINVFLEWWLFGVHTAALGRLTIAAIPPLLVAFIVASQVEILCVAHHPQPTPIPDPYPRPSPWPSPLPSPRRSSPPY